MSEDKWDGEERRGLPIHILRYIDERLEEQYNSFSARIDTLDDRFVSMTASLDSWMAKEPAALIEQCEKMVDEAIPHHPEHPDATAREKRHEHRRAHAKWIANVDAEMMRWKRIRENLLQWAIMGGAGMVLIAVWQYVLKGPHP
jgi:hypothetical protein